MALPGVQSSSDPRSDPRGVEGTRGTEPAARGIGPNSRLGKADPSVKETSPPPVEKPKTAQKTASAGYASVAVPVEKRLANQNDAHPGGDTLKKHGLKDWTRYTIYKFNVYDYQSYGQYKAAHDSGQLTAATATFELSFDPLGYNEFGNGKSGQKRHSILGKSELVKDAVFLKDTAFQETRSVKYGLAIYDCGSGKLTNPEYPRFGTSGVKFHGGGAYYSDQCATSPLKEYKPPKGNTEKIESGHKATPALISFERYLSKKLGISADHPRAVFVLPGTENKYSIGGGG